MILALTPPEVRSTSVIYTAISDIKLRAKTKVRYNFDTNVVFNKV